MLKVHHLRVGRSVFTVWFLEELGAPYELEIYVRNEMGRAPPELKNAHPLGKSPVIDDNGFVLAESGAIALYLLELGQALPFRMKNLACLASMYALRCDLDQGVLFRDGGKVEMGIPAPLQHPAGEIFFMQALHGDDCAALLFIVVARGKAVSIPFDHLLPGAFRIGILSLQRVINDQNVAAPTCQRAANRR